MFLMHSLLRLKFADTYVGTNSRRGMDKLFLSNVDLLVVNFSLNIFCWFPPAYATVQTLVKLASLNKSISM